MKFSERQGFKNYKDFIQVELMDESLRNSIWNTIVTTYYDSNSIYGCVRAIALHFRKTPLDELPYDNYKKLEWLKGYFYGLEWYEAYDLLEFLVSYHNIIIGSRYDDTGNQSECWNFILERENSGYRFLGGILAPISSPTEIGEVNETLQLTVRYKLQGPYDHIKTAIEHISKKPEPDFRNSIKESISAIESITKIISNEDSQGLAGALKVLGEKVNIHKALKTSFINLYGYTSDEGGIRHSLLEQSKVTYDEAKYMLVSCSAFLNYLIAKSVEAKVL